MAQSQVTLILSYNANGGSNTPSSQKKSELAVSFPVDVSITITSSKPTRSGYTFKGWATYSTASSPTYYSSGTYTYRFTSAGSHTTTLYAVWQANTCVLTYHPGAYGTGSIQTVTKTIGTNLTLKGAIYTRSGYTQTGWSNWNDGRSKNYNLSSSQYAIDEDHTLYPYWTQNTWTVSYKKGANGTGTETTDTKVEGTALTLKGAIFTRTGYTQTGWSTTDGGAKAYSLSASYTTNADVTLYPFWTANTFTITYKPGSSATGGSQTTDTKTYGAALTLKGAIFTRTGYTQTGWSTSDGGSKAYNLSASYTTEAAATLYPFWTINTYTVSYNKGANGTGTNTSDTKTYGVALTLKGAIFTRTGYTQTGWSTSDGGSKSYNLSASYTSNAGTTLYPYWTANTWTVSYNANGGSGAPSSQTKTYGQTLTLSSTVPTKTGYTFKGWATSQALANAGTVDYAAGGSYTANAAVTLYAVWEGKNSIIASLSSSVAMDGVSTGSLTLTRYKDSFTHTVVISYGSLSKSYNVSGTSLTFTIPESWNDAVTNSTSATATCTVKTYDGTTQIGSSVSSQFSITVPNNVKLSISSITHSEQTSGLSSEFSTYVQNKSTIKFTISIDSSQAHGATVESVSTTFNGKTYSGSTFTTYNVTASGTLSANVTVKDSRGRTITSSVNVVVAAYSDPQITISSLERANSGSTISINYSWAISPVNDENEKTITFYYKRNIDSSWTNAGSISGSEIATYAGTGTYPINNLSAFNVYNIRVKCSDYFTYVEFTSSSPAVGNRLFDCSSTDGTITIHGDNPNNNDGYDKWLEKPVRFYKTPDIVPRRCFASLSSAGWYRVLTFTASSANDSNGYAGSLLEINIGRYGSGNETHSIRFHIVDGKLAFSDENSCSYSQKIDKIRYTRNGSIGYIDIHATSSVSNVYADFVAHDRYSRQNMYFANALESVADAPSGETVYTTYSFTDNGTVINNSLTVNAPLFVAPHRCYSTLSSAGWYRVLTYAGYTSIGRRGSPSRIIKLHITRGYGGANNEIHEIEILQTYDSVSFVNETSKSNTQLIDKVRVTYNGNNLYVDIHYTGASSNDTFVSFDVYGNEIAEKVISSNALESVADAPSGETVMLTYLFTDNTNITAWKPVTRIENSYFNATVVGRIYYEYSGDVLRVYFNLIPSTPMPPSSGFLSIAQIPLPANRRMGYVLQTVPAQNGNGVLLVQITDTGLIQVYNGTSVTIDAFCRAMIPSFLIQA